MIKTLLGVLAAAVTALLAYVALLPATYRVERQIEIAAAPEAVFGHVNDFHKWQAWSPWAALDPNSKTTFEGAAAGKGAVFKWSGNAAVGSGSMEIADSTPSEALRIKLIFMAPFEGASDVQFKFAAAEGGKTRVTWAMDGSQGFIERLMCTVMGLSMDTMVGGQYETGLASLKRVVEAAKS